MTMLLDDIDKKLLNIMQVGFPLTREPFATLGLKLGIDTHEVLYRIKHLKEKGIVRQIGPVFEPRRLGYQITLAGMEVASEQLNKAAEVLNQHPGVSHNYEREHRFNLWFTLAIPAKNDMQIELEKLGNLIKAKAILNLPALRIFKARGYFDVVGDNWSMPENQAEPSHIFQGDIILSNRDRKIINELPQDIPLAQQPFDLISAQLSLEVNELLEQCQSLQQRGIMRRFGASISHSSVGFAANALVCWKIPSALIEVTGRKIATFSKVSHCYERKTTPLWHYNLFAMLHSHSREDCQEVAQKISEQISINEYELLFSKREFKKIRAKYVV